MSQLCKLSQLCYLFLSRFKNEIFFFFISLAIPRHFSFLNCPNFVIMFCQVLKREIFFLITLAIPRPLRSRIHWPINFSKKIDNSVYSQKTKKLQNWWEEKVVSAFEIVQTLLPFLSSLKMEIFFLIFLAIPRPSRSGVRRLSTKCQ